MGVVGELIRDGGPVLVVLMLLSVGSLTLIIWKIVDVWGITAGRARREAALADWQEGRRDQAVAAMQAGGAPADRVALYAMQSLGAGLRGPALEAELMRLGNEEMAAMMRHVRTLELIAMIAPLIGLLGTVLGMIESFRMLALAEGSANASVLAGGIWEALITTAAGLVVAIPAAIAASGFAARAEGGARAIEAAVGRLLLIEGAGAARA